MISAQTLSVCREQNESPPRTARWAFSDHALTKRRPYEGRRWLVLLLLGLGGLRRIRFRVGLGIGLRRRLRGLVHALDLGGLAQFRDVVGLRLARHIGFDLALDLVERGRLAAAL